MELSQRLAAVLTDVLDVTAEDDGALTVRHDGTLASLRVLDVADGLELVSLTQVLAWDLPVTKRLREQVTAQAAASQFGVVTLTMTDKHGDAMLRYNFPGTGLADDALRTMVLLVLDKGADIRRALTA